MNHMRVFIGKRGFLLKKVSKEVLEFYKQTSLYTDLGLYTSYAKSLPNDISELCILQRNQIIHPFDLRDEEMRKDSNSFYGDMTRIPKTSLCYENDLYPTAQAMLSELLRRDRNYSVKRKIEDKIHVCCREQAILLAATLKAKGISARVRSGFAKYVNTSGKKAGDHWLTEYYNIKLDRWTLVDADMYFDKDILDEYHIDFNLLDIPYEKFIFGAEAYLGMRKNTYKTEEIYYASDPATLGLKAALRGLFYDFHCLMNDEIIFLHMPKYIQDKNFELSEQEYQELDHLATLLLEPDKNFKEIQKIWNTETKYRIMSGALN